MTKHNEGPRGFQISVQLLDDYTAHCMSDAEFVEKFEAAARGEKNELSHLVKPWNCRLPQNEWTEIRSRIFARDDYTCTYCGARAGKLECDHITPVSKGGSHGDDNLTTACFTCNRSKRDKTVEQWKGATA